MSAFITLSSNTLQVEPREFGRLPSFFALQDWCKMHGIDPKDVVAGEPIIRGWRSITYTRLLRDEEGRRYVAPGTDGERATEVVKHQTPRRPLRWPETLRVDAKRERSALDAYLEEAVRELRRQAHLRFDIYGVSDARGAAFWDVAAALEEGRLIPGGLS